MQLSIIIISYNVKHFLEQCLCSLNKSIKDIDAEIWVVDNASTDGSVEYLERKFPGINFLQNSVNVGFAKANNQALAKCIGKYVLFLNPDTLVGEDCLVRSISFMETNALAGALGVRMIDGTGKFLPESKRSFPSPLASFYRLTGISTLFPRSKTFSRYSLTYLNEFENHEVDVLSGAFMLVRRNILNQLKGFDEAFFMYGEDIDLSYRILKLGYKNYYFSRSTVIHFKGESTRKQSLSYVKTFYQAMSIFVKKHSAGRTAYINTLFLHIAVWLRAGISATAQFGSKIITLVTGQIGDFKRRKNLHFLVFGDDEEYQEVKTLLAYAGIGEEILSHVQVNQEKFDIARIICELRNSGAQAAATHIIFGMEKISYRIAIETMQEFAGSMSFRFYVKGTGSIVGSDSKNSSGQVIAASNENYSN